MTSQRSLTLIPGALLGLAMLLLIRRYSGIHHDSILYLGQGLLHRWPEIYGNDLFFLHGGQDRYSLLPWFLGTTFQWFEPSVVFLWGTVACLLAFALASWHCLRMLLPPGQRYWAWLGILCLPSMYGVVSIFSYGEPFLTSRLIAEAFCLLGIGLLAGGRWRLAGACLAAGGLFHPLQAIGAALVVWPWLVMRDKRWVHALWLLLPALLLALANVRPFDGLLRQADPAWLGSLQDSWQLFLTSWRVIDLQVLAFDVFLLACGWKGLGGPFGKWCQAGLIGLVLGFGASLLLSDMLHLVLPMGLQLWRVQWLAHWLAIAALAGMLFRDFHAANPARALLLALFAHLAWGGTSWSAFALAVLYVGWPRLIAGDRARLERWLALALGLILAVLFAGHATSELDRFALAGYRLETYPLDRTLLAFPTIALGLPLLGVFLWERATRIGRFLITACLLLPLLALGIASWDTRSPLMRAVEGASFRSDIFGVTIPEDAQVYWTPEMLTGPWLVLRRASYFSPGQLAGQMFSRETAVDGRAREARVLPLSQEIAACRSGKRPLGPGAQCRISDANMRLACAPGPTKAPDYLVLPYQQPRAALGHWSIVDPDTNQPAMTFWLYACEDVVDVPASPMREGVGG